jgi:hypothetical protein
MASGNYCHKHNQERLNAGKETKREPIKKVSDKRAKLNAAYSVLKKSYIKRFPKCQVNLQGCKGEAIDIHHLFSGKNRAKYFLDETTWKGTCNFCHRQIHDKLSMEEAIEKGLKRIDN